jgi:hypothetical protein
MLAAILALTRPEAEAGVEVLRLPSVVVGGIGLSLGDLGEKGRDVGAGHEGDGKVRKWKGFTMKLMESMKRRDDLVSP